MGEESKVQYGWGDLDHRFQVWIFRDGWKDEEFLRVHEASERETRWSRHKYTLVDFRVRRVPLNIIPLARYSLSSTDNLRRIVVVVDDDLRWQKMLHLLGAALAHIGQRLCFVTSMDEAYQIIGALLAAEDCELRASAERMPAAPDVRR